jgi:hypothetical protein
VVTFTPQPLYLRVKNLLDPLDRRLGGPQSWSGRGGEEKKSPSLSIIIIIIIIIIIVVVVVVVVIIIIIISIITVNRSLLCDAVSSAGAMQCRKERVRMNMKYGIGRILREA